MAINKEIQKILDESEETNTDNQEIETKEAVVESKPEEITVDVSSDVDALMNGEELSEEFKVKAATIFEAAVVTRVKEEIVKLQEGYDTKLEEAVNVVRKELVEKVDGYLDYMVEQWLKDNEVALTHGVKVEMMENFMTGMKTLFTENYVNLPEEKFDVLTSLEARNADIESALAESEKKNVELTKVINENKRKSLVAEATDGLSDTQVDKFKTLAEELVFENEESFKEKLKIIRENYITSRPKASVTESKIETIVTDTVIVEEVETTKSTLSPVMESYTQFIKQSTRK